MVCLVDGDWKVEDLGFDFDSVVFGVRFIWVIEKIMFLNGVVMVFL